MFSTLQNEIEQKLNSLNYCLQSLKNQQLDLDEHCIKVKNSISIATEAQLAHLRLRERQLSRQTEVR